MPTKRTGLGKGLDALIPKGGKDTSQESIQYLAVDEILPNPRQPRNRIDPAELSELAESIREHGILQPLVVARPLGEEQYVLIAGQRRLEAARLIGLERVPATVRQVTEQQMLELALIENLQRTDLNALEAAEAYRQLAEEFNLSHEQISERVGKSRAAISNTLRLLKLPASVQQALRDNRISEGHARALLALPSPQAQAAILQVILERSLSVRQTEELVRKYSGQKPAKPPRPSLAPELAAVEDRLRSHLGTRVTLQSGRKGGLITIHYYSEEELDALVERLLGG